MIIKVHFKRLNSTYKDYLLRQAEKGVRPSEAVRTAILKELRRYQGKVDCEAGQGKCILEDKQSVCNAEKTAGDLS